MIQRSVRDQPSHHKNAGLLVWSGLPKSSGIKVTILLHSLYVSRDCLHSAVKNVLPDSTGDRAAPGGTERAANGGCGLTISVMMTPRMSSKSDRLRFAAHPGGRILKDVCTHYSSEAKSFGHHTEKNIYCLCEPPLNKHHWSHITKATKNSRHAHAVKFTPVIHPRGSLMKEDFYCTCGNIFIRICNRTLYSALSL